MSGMSEGLLIQILLVLYYGRYSTFSSLTTAVVTLKMTSILDGLPHKSTVDRQWNMSCQSLCVYGLAIESWITSMTLLQGWRGSYSAKMWHTFSMPASTPFATKPNILLKQRKNRYEVYDYYVIMCPHINNKYNLQLDTKHNSHIVSRLSSKLPCTKTGTSLPPVRIQNTKFKFTYRVYCHGFIIIFFFLWTFFFPLLICGCFNRNIRGVIYNSDVLFPAPWHCPCWLTVKVYGGKKMELSPH